jgi:hypothetical protein
MKSVAAGLVTLLALILMPCYVRADEVTPAGEKTAASSSDSEAAEAPVSFEQAARELSTVFPIQLDQFADVVQHPYNWNGPKDASMKCDIGFTPTAIIIKGEMLDDVSFEQVMEQPAMPNWWKITYGADGLEFQLDNPTSAAQQLHFALNFGSRGLHPRVEMLNSPAVTRPAFLKSAVLEYKEVPAQSADTNHYQFQAAIPVSGFADPKFFAGPLRITVRMHDVDGDFSTYSMLQKVIEKK